MLIVIIIFLALILDRITKIWIMAHMSVGDSLVFIPHLFNITYVRNYGAAFSILQQKHAFLLAVTGIAMLLILVYMIKKRKTLGVVGTASLSLILAGGLGNLWDRVALGYVPDFLECTFIHFPVFNVADIAVCGGCILLLLYVIFLEPKKDSGAYHR